MMNIMNKFNNEEIGRFMVNMYGRCIYMYLDAS